MVSFALASSHGFLTLRRAPVQRSGSSHRGLLGCCWPASVGPPRLCVANYIYVFFAAAGTLPSTFQIYLFVGAIYWATAATGVAGASVRTAGELEMVAELQARKGCPSGEAPCLHRLNRGVAFPHAASLSVTTLSAYGSPWGRVSVWAFVDAPCPYLAWTGDRHLATILDRRGPCAMASPRPAAWAGRCLWPTMPYAVAANGVPLSVDWTDSSEFRSIKLFSYDLSIFRSATF